MGNTVRLVPRSQSGCAIAILFWLSLGILGLLTDGAARVIA